MCNHHQNSNKMRHGSALEHGEAHEQDHRQWSRRSFLQTLGIGGGVSLMLGNMPLNALMSAPLAFALDNSETDRVLVLIRFKGGNDGLNTIIPVFDYGRYQALRPNIRIAQSDILNLSAEFGVPNTMNALQPLWSEGSMKVVHSVGYPNQNLSHFRSSDIWASASDANVVDRSGWLGRYLQDLYPDFLLNPPAVPPAIQIGSVGNQAFIDTNDTNISVSVNEPEELAEIARNGQLYSLSNLPACLYGEQLGYIRAVTNSTFVYAGAIKQAHDAAANQVAYPAGNFGRQLAIVARLIKGNLGTKLYMVTLDGFDTHAGQNDTHPRLLMTVADAVQAFYQDLRLGNRAQDVLSMTISEFGRRPEQNASRGTDHGAAAPVFLFGEGLNGNGFVGTGPDLQNLDNNGNLRFHTDFRQIYATVLENWLCVDANTVNTVLGNNFNRMPLGLSCAVTSTLNGTAARGIAHRVSYISEQQVRIHYTLPTATNVRVEIFNLLGQPVTTLHNGYQMAGEHQVEFAATGGLASGQYFYRIQAGGKVAAQSIRLVR
ncbi:MAG TPA: DUF1501 domain-containing protein [Saprospiraceae bacterium]|nr:DUF1501 domain-containing protein [Saprospiraceae bacterium]HMP23522.1 DUF1501 domain-containing protein [Saprospiraceae bacterium]